MNKQLSALEYVGFWARVWASLVDTVLLMLVSIPLVYLLQSLTGLTQPDASLAGLIETLVLQILPIVIVLAFWWRLQATPGKLLVHARIIDADSGGVPQTWQWLVRYLGYFVIVLSLGLGVLWVAFDKRKQGWHDKLARTVVVRVAAGATLPG